MYPSHQARSRLSIWRFGHRFIHSAVLARHALTLALSNSAIAVFFFFFVTACHGRGDSVLEDVFIGSVLCDGSSEWCSALSAFV